MSSKVETYYDLLEVDVSADASQIRKAYLRRAAECHPDKNPDNPAATRLFQELNKAHEVLRDPQARARYDITLLTKSHPHPSLNNRHPPPPPPPANPSARQTRMSPTPIWQASGQNQHSPPSLSLPILHNMCVLEGWIRRESMRQAVLRNVYVQQSSTYRQRPFTPRLDPFHIPSPQIPIPRPLMATNVVKIPFPGHLHLPMSQTCWPSQINSRVRRYA
ncbi:hypothetical protein M231_03175 [Tremella mesenterica]|uniref:J domain-containing protein n=1 Tax=Tremella mesenterica TaxID=5217 RepID=A0A4Q1BNR4_TREME|nr:hypothetical protein M231_03175 [Tremella mesenterica]